MASSQAGINIPLPNLPPSDSPSMMTALQEQLGLRLDSQRAPVDVLVIVPPDTELHRSVDWMSQVAREWKAELNLSDEDLYSPSDGEPVDDTR